MILLLFVIVAFCTSRVGALYVDVDVTLHIDGLEAVTLTKPGWYQVESRAWVCLKEAKKSIAGVPLYIRDPIGAKLAQGFRAPASLNEAENFCTSKLFHIPQESLPSHFAVTLNEVYGLRFTLPASLAVLNSMGLFVKLSLYRKIKPNGDRPEGDTEHVGSKLVRVSNVLAGVDDYTELVIENLEDQCNISLEIHAGLRGLRESKEPYEPATLKPGLEFNFWVDRLQNGDNSIVYHWFNGADVEELDEYYYKEAFFVPRRVFEHFLKFLHIKQPYIAGTKIGKIPVDKAILKDNQDGTTPQSTENRHACVNCRQHLFESLFNAFAKLFAQRLLQTLALSSGNNGAKEPVDYLKLLGSQKDLGAFQFFSKISLKGLEFVGTVYRETTERICDCGSAERLNIRLNQYARGLGVAVVKGEKKNIVYIGLENCPSLILRVDHENYSDMELQDTYKLFQEKFKPLTDRLDNGWEQYVDASVRDGLENQSKKFWDSLKKYVWDVQGKEKPANWKKLRDEFLTQNLMDEHHFFLMHTSPFATFKGNVSSKRLERKNQDEHLLVLVHGEGETKSPFQPLQDNLGALSGFTHVLKLPVNSEGEQKLNLTQLGDRLCHHVDKYLQENPRGQKAKYISFLGHSYGGLVIRAALPKLARYQEMFNALVTIATPHLGYPHIHSRKTKAVRDLNCKVNLSDCEAKKEVELQDNNDKKQTLLYKMCLDDTIRHFEVVRLFGVKPDVYCPACSALLQTDCIKDKNNLAHEMAEHLKKRIGEDGFSTVKLNYRLAASYIGKPTCKESHAAILHQRVQTRLLVALTSDIF